MQFKYKLGMSLMPCTLVVSFICTVVAIFVPHVAEWILGLTSVCLIGFSMCFCYATDWKLIWSDYVALLVICLSAILTMMLTFGGYLHLYAVIEGLNLLTILGISIALLFRKNANRTVLWIIISLCLLFFGISTYSHIARIVIV